MSTLNKTRLKLEQVAVYRNGQPILTDFSLELVDRQIYMIIGPSGVGKSTFLNVLAGLQELSAGTMTLAGAKFQPKEHVIGLVPQNYGLLPWETAYQAVANSLQIKTGRKLTNDNQQLIRKLFAKLELTGLEGKFPQALSGGQQQRVSLARGFAVAEDLLLMDEPFSALDAFTREKIQDLFINLWQEQPQLTCFITHDVEEAILLGHKIVVIDGKPGRVKKVLDNPFTGEVSLAERRQSPELFAWTNQLREELWQGEK